MEKWLIQPGESKVIDLEIVRSLKLSLIGGQIDIIGHDEQGARVEVHSVSGKDLKVSIEGDHLEIDHPQLRWDNFIEVFSSFRGSARADISVLVPRDVALKFGVVQANALVSGLNNDAKVSTVSGDLVIDGISGDIEANTVNGEISIQNHSGRIRAHTVSGDVTASGDIRKFDAEGVSGDVYLDLAGIPDAISNSTVSGHLTMRLGDTVSTRYRINTVSGTLQLDGQTIKGTFGRGYTGTSGSLDGTWTEIAANSVSGHISVIRQARTDDAESGASAASGTAASGTAASGTESAPA